ncbi:GNAT family N-acetyltransferase [Streptomyces sp. NPDC090085]|uniref:GNAT family N-acetyltransferase n=1 Tax=Streptomyces sp. NPDC090085 TaxID=3365943 RepID=UPI0037F79817
MPNPSRPRILPLDLASDPGAAAAVHGIGRAAYAVEAELIGFDGIPALHEDLGEMLARPLHWLGAVPGEGGIAGFLAWEEAEDGGVAIDRLCVAPAWFRRGVASGLLRHALAEAFPGRHVEVTTGAANTPAVTLYTRFGFVRGADFSPAPGLRMASFTTGPAAGTGPRPGP